MNNKNDSVFRNGLILFIIGIISIFSLSAQDINYTLFNFSPLFLNSANTGNFDGSYRLAVNFRSQSNASANAFRTATVSFDKSFMMMGQKIAAGVYFVNDEAGIKGISYNKVYGSVGYIKDISNNIFSIGLQAGYVFSAINDWNVWNASENDFTAPSGETSLDNNSYPDINAGILWKSSINILEPEAGISVYHLNKPNISFLGGDEKENIKLAGHLNIKINVTDKWFVVPAFLYFNLKESNFTVLGSDIGYNFTGNNSRVDNVHLGLYLRNGIFSEMESMAVTAGSEVGRMRIALSYDMNLSAINKAGGNNLGAFEVSLIYKGISTVLNTYSIPCERY